MLRFVLRRLLQTIPVILVIITATFFMVRFVPGGPFTAEKAIPPEILKNLEAHYGLDQPLWRQYLLFLADIGSGSLGRSVVHARPVMQLVLERLPATLWLVAYATVLAVAMTVRLIAGPRPALA